MRKLELPLALPMKSLPMHMRFKRALTDKALQTFCERQEALQVEREPNGSLSVRPIWGTHAGREPEDGHSAVYGEGPVAGFVLELARIWS